MSFNLHKIVTDRPVAGLVASLALHLIFFGTLLVLRTPSVTYVVKRGEPLFIELPPSDEPAPAGNPAGRATGSPGAEPVAPTPVLPEPSPPTAAAKKSSPSPKVSARSRSSDAEQPAFKSSKAPAARSKEASETLPPDPSKLVAAIPPKPSVPPPPPSSDQREPSELPHAGRPEATGSQGAKVPGPAPAPDIRAALGRGAGEAAGGRTGGRGGIEGEPIPLDSTDPKYSDYLDRVRRMIKEKWGYPCVKDSATRRCEYKTAQLVIEFGIAKSGEVPFINLRRSSGYTIMDDYALNAVKFASPFPPVPDTVSRKGIPILATFHYMVDTSLVNLLR